MEQDKGGGGRGVAQMMQQPESNQKGLSRSQLQNQQHPPPQQPQKCPRCESLNTKFCYYNNYSLSQPRYFCKTCRRYWTQGGTLRNVPVGGGCRKGKRMRDSSSPDGQINNTSGKSGSIAPPLRNKGLDASLGAQAPPPPIYYASGVGVGGGGGGGGGGFLSSLASSYQSFNQPINVGGEFGLGGSNLALLQGFSLPFHTQQLHPHQQQHQQHQEPNLYLHQSHDLNLEMEEKVAPNRPSGSHQDWSQSFNSGIIPPTEAADYWNTTNNNTGCTGTSNQPTTHWTDHLSGYGGPQQQHQQQHHHLQQQPPPSSTTTTSSSPPPSFL